MSLLALGSDTLDIMAVGDAMDGRGRPLDRQTALAALHMMVPPNHAQVDDALLADLRAAASAPAAVATQQRAAGLTEAELDWRPTDSGWPLRRVLHHLARSERFYAAALDEALPEGDPPARYKQACRRLEREIRGAADRGTDPSIVHAGLYGALHTPAEVVDLVLAIEGERLAGGR